MPLGVSDRSHPRGRHELQNKRVRRESSVGQPEERVSQAYAQEVPRPGRTGASSQSSLCRLDDGGHQCGMRSVREVRSTHALPATALRRVARGFHSFSRRDGGTEEPPGQPQRDTTASKKAARLPHLLQDHLKNFNGQRSIAENGFSGCLFAAERCPHRDRRENAPLWQRSRIGGSTKETHSRRKSNVGLNDSATPLMWPSAVHRKFVDSYSPSMDETSPACKHGLLLLLAPFWPRPSWSLSSQISPKHAGARIRVLASQSLLARFARTAALALSQ